jgi:hypothetical protein
VDEGDRIDNLTAEEEAATLMTMHRVPPDHGQHIHLFLPFELFTREAVYQSFSRKISSLATKSKASLRTC